MKLTKFDKPQAVEYLVFEVKPELVDKFIDLDHEVWTMALSKYEGFLSKEVWVSSEKPGEVSTIIYWSDYDLWKAIDHHELEETQKLFDEKMGIENYKFIAAHHETNQSYRVAEYK